MTEEQQEAALAVIVAAHAYMMRGDGFNREQLAYALRRWEEVAGGG